MDNMVEIKLLALLEPEDLFALYQRLSEEANQLNPGFNRVGTRFSCIAVYDAAVAQGQWLMERDNKDRDYFHPKWPWNFCTQFAKEIKDLYILQSRAKSVGFDDGAWSDDWTDDEKCEYRQWKIYQFVEWLQSGEWRN